MSQGARQLPSDSCSWHSAREISEHLTEANEYIHWKRLTATISSASEYKRLRDEITECDGWIMSRRNNLVIRPAMSLEFSDVRRADHILQEVEMLRDLTSEIGDSTSIPSVKADGSARVGKARARAAANVITDVIIERPSKWAKSEIITPPWYRLGDVVQVVVGKKYFEAVIRPTIADVQYEHHEALMSGRNKEAVVIRWRGFLQILWVTVVSPVEKLIKKIGFLAG